MSSAQLVTIGWAYGTSDTYMALAMLKSAGIPAHPGTLHFLNMNWTLAHACGGIAIQVPRSEAPEAWEILADFRGNSARRWRRWHWLIFAVIVTLWLPVPPPSNGYTPAARWLAAAAGEE